MQSPAPGIPCLVSYTFSAGTSDPSCGPYSEPHALYDVLKPLYHHGGSSGCRDELVSRLEIIRFSGPVLDARAASLVQVHTCASPV